MWNIKNCQRNFFKVFEALKRHWKPWEVDTELLKWNWLGENCCVVVKNMSANAEDARDTSPVPRVKKIPLSRKWQPTPVFFPESTMDKGASQAMGSQRVGHNWVHTQVRSTFNLLFPEGILQSVWVYQGSRWKISWLQSWISQCETVREIKNWEENGRK